MTPFPVGKLPAPVLARMLAKNRIDDPRVLVGSKVGEDATVIDFGETCLVAKTDPITFATDRIGWYAVNINANDIATMGARPKWFLITVLLPEGPATEELVQGLFDDIRSACDALEVSLCGGHTEITYDLNRPLVIGQMLGEVPKEKLVVSSNARPGDAVILTKGVPIEGTSIIAREKEAELLPRYGAELVERAKNFLTRPGISVVKDALTANDAGGVHAMHDPTEGGLATGLAELAIAADAGIIVDADKIHVYPDGRALCEELNLDPLGVIASGALLVVAAPDQTDAICSSLTEAGIESSVIGEMTAKDAGLKLRRGPRVTDLPSFQVDEITRLF